jgi:5'(3')-deoxyribonucleotidase
MSLDLLTNTARPVETRLKVVGCDLDDVLADFMGRFIDMASERFGIPADKTLRPIDWEWSNMGWSKEQESALWQQLHDTPDFWITLDIIPGVDRQLVRELSDRTSLYFPTARAEAIGTLSTRDQCARWLVKNFNIAYPTVIVSTEKGPLAAALKYDYFADDRPKNCYEVKAARPECNVILVDSSHNRDRATTDKAGELGIPRVSGFNEFAQMVLEG